MKYTDVFKLREYPFNLTPDLRFYYRSLSQRRALAYLTSGLTKAGASVVIPGPLGAAKPFFIAYSLDTLRKNNASPPTLRSTQFTPKRSFAAAPSAFGLRIRRARLQGPGCSD